MYETIQNSATNLSIGRSKAAYRIEPLREIRSATIWIATHRKEIFFRPQKGCAPVSFESIPDMMRYVYDRINNGFLVG